MDFDDKIPQDGETFALSDEQDCIKAEFINSSGRICWRLCNRIGQGIMLTEDELRRLILLSNNYLDSVSAAHIEDTDGTVG